MNKKYSIILMITSIFILQWHGIIFWTQQSGNIGAAWSLIIEMSAIWFWWQRQRFFIIMGFLSTLLVIVAPLYQVSIPLIVGDKMRNAQVTALQLNNKVLLNQVTQLQTTQTQLLRNSEKRSGWAVAINETKNSLLKTRADILRNTQEIAELSVSKNQQTWLIIIKIIALLVFQILNISIIKDLSRPKKIKEAINQRIISHAKFMQAFADLNTDRLSPEKLAFHLKMSESEMKSVLKKIGIVANNVRIDGLSIKGYKI